MRRNLPLVIVVLFLLSVLPIVQLKAQALCGFDMNHSRELQHNPAYKMRVDALEKEWAEFNKLRNTSRYIIGAGNDTIYEIPVVVHVINPGGSLGSMYNPTDSQISGWIDYLNQVYSTTYAGYPDSSNGGTYFPVRFALAKRSPSCDTTNGILHVDASGLTDYVNNGVNQTTAIGVNESVIRGLSRWDPNNYYNIYVVNKFDGVDGNGPGSYLAGYAYFAGASTDVDGSFMLAKVAVAGQSTLPHEMGHALGLYHPFEGSNGSTCPANADCTTDNDKVCDTEPCVSLLGVYPCPTAATVNACTGSNYQGVQNNIMNYGYCLNKFTPGQRSRALLQLKSLRLKQISAIVSTYPAGHVKAASCVTTTTNSSNTFGMGPRNVFLGDMSYYSGGFDNDGFLSYIDNSCTRQATVNANSSNTLTVTTQTNPQHVIAYIDYNNDGNFSASEIVLDHLGTLLNETHTATFTLPANTVLDTPLRMRVVADWASSATPSSCGALDYGQAEDFSVLIKSLAPLPVVLKNITASPASGAVAITVNWETASEDELDNWILERSSDGKYFTAVEKIKAHGFASFYTHQDAQVVPGNRYYYRLKMENRSGRISYSKTASALIDKQNVNSGFYVYPNPVTNELNFIAPIAGNWKLQILNNVGQVIEARTVTTTANETVNWKIATAIPTGIYYLQARETATGNSYTVKFVK